MLFRSGFYRNGSCDSEPDDIGVHSVCVVVTEEFLEFSKAVGNDLSTPRPQYQFAGLKAGDKWCLCASRWVEAWRAGKAPKVILEATNEKTLEYIDLHELVKFGWKGK